MITNHCLILFLLSNFFGGYTLGFKASNLLCSSSSSFFLLFITMSRKVIPSSSSSPLYFSLSVICLNKQLLFSSIIITAAALFMISQYLDKEQIVTILFSEKNLKPVYGTSCPRQIRERSWFLRNEATTSEPNDTLIPRSF